MTWHKTMLGQIGLLAAALAVLGPVYVVVAAMRGQPPRVLPLLIVQYALPVTILAWIAADAKERRRTPCFDYGFFLLATWPLSLFWYCISTRGWRGLGLAVGLLLLCWLPMMFMGVVDAVRIIANQIGS
jgi:hypothetical protein